MSYLKPQTPLQHKDGDYFYPLTTIDQIIMEDGVTRLNGADLVSVNTDGAPEGETAGINADTLGGYAADAYIRQDSSKSLLSIDLNEIVNGTASPINADMLGNVPAEKVFSDLDGKVSMELIWENASPTSEFAKQDVFLDIKSSDMIMIISLTSTTSLYGIDTICAGNLFIHADGVKRSVDKYDGKLSFSDAYIGSNVNNAQFIPHKIFLIKGVSA